MAQTESSLVKRLRRELAKERAMRLALEGEAPPMPILTVPGLEHMGERVTVDLYMTVRG